MAADEWESFDRDRERAAIVGLALAQLPNEAQVREGLLEDFGETFPELGESLEVLARLTGAGLRTSQRTMQLQLLAKVARNRGTEPLHAVANELRRFVHISIEDGARLSELRALRARQAADEAMRREAEAPPVEALPEEASADEGDPPSGDAEQLAPAPPPSPAGDADEVFVFTAGSTPDAEQLLAHEDELAGPVDVFIDVEVPEAPVEPAGGPPLAGDGDDPAADAVYGALDACASSTASDGDAWEVFAAGAHDSLQLTDAEVHLPTCSDSEVVSVGGKEAFRVITQFSSTEPVQRFLRWTDVRTWDTDCSLFYKSVKTVVDGKIPPGADEYSELFLEVVRFSQNLTLETPLIFTRSLEIPDDPTTSATVYLLQFRLPKGVETDHIAVDSGSLLVRYDPDLGSVDLVAEKAISFKAKAMKNWPTLSCDLMWMEMSILAALGCVDKGT